jgi:tetratricopeptide (TPR) repeat protein
VAHLAGAVLGGLLGLAIGWQRSRKRIAISLLSLLMVLIVVAASVGRRYVNLSNTAGQEFAARAYKEQTQGHHDNAVSLYRQALEFDSRQASWWYNLGIAHQALGQIDQAIEAYEHAVALSPKEDRFRHALDALRSPGWKTKDSARDESKK